MLVYTGMLHEILKQLGFSDKEIAIYLCILERGKATAAVISRITKINRTTIYSITKELLAKGVITEDLGGASRYFTALPPEDLRKLYIQEEETLKRKRNAIEQAITELAMVPKSKQYSVPKIRFIDERHVNDFLYKQLPIWIESAKNRGDKHWWGFQDPTLLEEYREWMEYHWKIFPEDFGMRMFTNKKPAEEAMAARHSPERRQILYWDKAGEFSATHAVMGDYVLFLVSREHPHYLVEINDAVMAENMRQLFKGMWEEIQNKQ